LTAYLAPRPEDVYDAETRIGAVLVPTMPIYRHDEVRYVLQHSGAKLAVVAGEFRGFDYPDMLGEIRASAPGLQHVISVRCGERPGVLRFEDLIAGTGVPDPSLLGEPPPADAPHCVIYTSGTESRPKGCLHTLNTITFTVHALGGEVMAMGPGDVMFMPSPITHATGLAMGVIAPLILGAGVHLMDVWDAEAGLRRIAEHRCTMSMTATPFVQITLNRLLADPASAAQLATMRCWACAGAPIPEVMLRGWSQQVPGCALLPVYGRSEGLLVTACTAGDSAEHVLSSDGRAFPGVVLAISDEDGKPASAGTEGEICHGGLNISAAEVENHLLAHPRVAAAAVVAAPDHRLARGEGLRVRGRARRAAHAGGADRLPAPRAAHRAAEAPGDAPDRGRAADHDDRQGAEVPAARPGPSPGRSAVVAPGCLAGYGARSASFLRRARMSAWTTSGGCAPSTVNIHSRPA